MKTLMPRMSERFLPSLNQVKNASKELPDAELWPEDEYAVPVEGKNRVHELIFKRIKFKSRSNGKTYRWVYEGKIMISEKKERE